MPQSQTRCTCCIGTDLQACRLVVLSSCRSKTLEIHNSLRNSRWKEDYILTRVQGLCLHYGHIDVINKMKESGIRTDNRFNIKYCVRLFELSQIYRLTVVVYNGLSHIQSLRSLVRCAMEEPRASVSCRFSRIYNFVLSFRNTRVRYSSFFILHEFNNQLEQLRHNGKKPVSTWNFYFVALKKKTSSPFIPPNWNLDFLHKKLTLCVKIVSDKSGSSHSLYVWFISPLFFINANVIER